MDFTDFKNKKLLGLYGSVVGTGVLLVALLNPNSILGLPNGVLGNLGSLSGLFGGSDDHDSDVAEADADGDTADAQDGAGAGAAGQNGSDVAAGSGRAGGSRNGGANASPGDPTPGNGAPGVPGTIPGQPIQPGGQIPGTPGTGTIPRIPGGSTVGPILSHPGPLPLPAPLPAVNNPVPGVLAPLQPVVRPILRPVIRHVPRVSVPQLSLPNAPLRLNIGL